MYPYYLHFDGVSREPAGHSGIGAVLTTPNQQHDFGHVSTYIGSRSSERLAKYKALLAGLDNALKCGIKCLLACGEDKFIVNQVVTYQTEHDFTVQLHIYTSHMSNSLNRECFKHPPYHCHHCTLKPLLAIIAKAQVKKLNSLPFTPIQYNQTSS